MIVDRPHSPDWQYSEMPQNLYYPIRDALRSRNFADEAIRTNYPFTDQHSKPIHLNCVAFADRTRWDADTASVALYYNPNIRVQEDSLVERIAVSGAPIVILGKATTASLFGISVNGRPQANLVQSDIAYSDMPIVLERYAADINPRKILDVKHGFAYFVTAFSKANPLQLRLWAVDATKDILVQHFSAAVGSIQEDFKRRKVTYKKEQLDTKLAIQLLGATILAHKGRLGEKLQSPNVGLNDILVATQNDFKHYFDRKFFETHWKTCEDAYSILQKVFYSNFTPQMLDELYLKAYSIEIRKAEGRFNTPLYLTQRILNNIPIEFIRPSERLVADITCGWGSFLIAGYERLSQMNDMEESGQPLWKHIVGNDKDPFTAQLASLALLTSSLNDSWEVKHEDALQMKWSGNRPTVIVGNPKFFADRKAGKKATETNTNEGGERKRLQEADRFLKQAINFLKPNGYIGMVMPQSFTTGESSTATRKILLEQCDISEMWDLPLTTFGKQASVSPMVIFAKKRIKSGDVLNAPVRIRVAQGKILEQAGKFTTSMIALSQGEWDEHSKKGRGENVKVTHLIDYTTILSQTEWRDIQSKCKKLVDVIDFTQGAIVGNKNRGRWAKHPLHKKVKWLSGGKVAMPAQFSIDYDNVREITYPNDLEWPRMDKEHLLSSSKVLLVSNPNPSWGKRAKVAIERKGFYVSDSFWVLVPKPKTFSLEVLAAILSWDVSNAWIVEHLRYPKIQRRALDSISIPALSEHECDILENAIREIESAASRSESAPKAQQMLDAVLKHAYNLDEKTFRTLRRVMKWDNKTSTLNDKNQQRESMFIVSGQVEKVDASVNSVTLWFDGIEGIYTIPIVDEMPGWMLREGASFGAEVSHVALKNQDWKNLIWWNIRPKEYTYLEESELLDKISAEMIIA